MTTVLTEIEILTDDEERRKLENRITYTLVSLIIATAVLVFARILLVLYG